MATCSPGLYPAASIAATTASTASLFERRSGAQPPSSPTPVRRPRERRMSRRAWNTSEPMRTASLKVRAPSGATMNSWMSTLLSAWAPPSRSSTASRDPVEAPEGTAARPRRPPSTSTSTSTVGLPRESRISLARTSPMRVMLTPSGHELPRRLEERPEPPGGARLGVAAHHRLRPGWSQQDPRAVVEDHLPAVRRIDALHASPGKGGRNVFEPPRQTLARRGVPMIVDAPAVQRTDLAEKFADLIAQ